MLIRLLCGHEMNKTCVQNFAFKFQAVAEITAKIVRGLLYFAAPCTLWVERNGMTEQNETSLQQFPAFYGITATFVHITAVFRLSPLLCSSLA